jgi:choline-sulfatase
VSRVTPIVACVAAVVIWSGCRSRDQAGPAQTTAPRAQNLVIVTIDTLRADRVGAYGYSRARTPALDSLARGVRFDRAYAAAPITLPSHATMLTGRYPPGHGSRDNGMRVSESVPTLATVLQSAGFKTGAFVAAFPLDHQFGLDRGFGVYSDRLPRGPDGRPANERPAAPVIDEVIAWIGQVQSQRFFAWVHLFEPHAPYGNPTTPAEAARPALDRYDDEIASADRELGRLFKALESKLGETLIVATSDHGEAFGEHGEWAHSIFVYDTTLRVPLLMAGPGISAPPSRADAGIVITAPVSLADMAPTAAKALGVEMNDVDGIDLAPQIAGVPASQRELYAESFAPLLQFGWAPLRSLRSGPWKVIAAPRPELYNIEQDPGEHTDVAGSQSDVVRSLDERVGRISGTALPSRAQPADAAGVPDAQSVDRLRALGYSAGSQRDLAGPRPDPKDRRELAARIAQVTSGELSGAALVTALESIVRDDPNNGLAHLRLGYLRLQSGDCRRAEAEFRATLASGLASADAHLGLATCLGRRRDLSGAERALAEARRLEPGNPVITANIAILQAETGDAAAAIRSFEAALAADPELHEARFNLALTYARAGQREAAAAHARRLLDQLPPDSVRRLEVQRLLKALQ